MCPLTLYICVTPTCGHVPVYMHTQIHVHIHVHMCCGRESAPVYACRCITDRDCFLSTHLARSNNVNNASGHCLCHTLLRWGSGSLKVLQVDWGGPGLVPAAP